LQQGTGYTAASNLATTGGSGTGCEITISTIGESPLEAVTACRIQNPNWYICSFVGTAADADKTAIASYIEGASPASQYFTVSSEASVLNGSVSSLPGLLQALDLRRTLCTYATTQGGTYPLNAHISGAAAGYAMGANNQAADSYFDLNDKTLYSVAAEPGLTPTQIQNIRGTWNREDLGLNCNLLVVYNNGAYTLFQAGLMSGGTFFDLTLFVDMLAADIQTSLMAYRVSQQAVPITDQSMVAVKGIIEGACTRSQVIGFIAPSGTWQGGTIGTGSNQVVNGQAFPQGFYVYVPSVTSLSQAQVSARILPPVVVAVIASGSGNSMAISLQIQQ
jgi:hypothetical protein